MRRHICSLASAALAAVLMLTPCSNLNAMESTPEEAATAFLRDLHADPYSAIGKHLKHSEAERLKNTILSIIYNKGNNFEFLEDEYGERFNLTFLENSHPGQFVNIWLSSTSYFDSSDYFNKIWVSPNPLALGSIPELGKSHVLIRMDKTTIQSKLAIIAVIHGKNGWGLAVPEDIDFLLNFLSP